MLLPITRSDGRRLFHDDEPAAFAGFAGAFLRQAAILIKFNIF